MCNLYSLTKGQAAIIALVGAMRDRTGNLPPMSGVFPDYLAPIARNTPEGVRELATARWGMPGPRSFGRGDTVYDPWHYVPVLARKPGALRNGAPFKDWVLPAAMERVRRKLAGAEDGNRQMVDILTTVLTDGLPAVEAACAEAIAQGVHSADVVLNILARQRDPGPPATILTPAALTLRHAPIADCARYDNLRRTN
jgi:hypothetical protein